ncbi:MAG TPA: glycine cleavage system protein GcvH [Trueperaceae bacterium]|nr:glycine cleavage system protein GcvH [Trueperaceae bacterium]
MSTPESLRYAATHEWARKDDDGTVVVGITDFAQDQLGDVVFVELPEVGRKVVKGDTLAVIESVKTASDIYAPVSGEVVAVNDALDAKPETINESPYEDGWLFAIAPSNEAEYDELLDAQGYAATLDEG